MRFPARIGLPIFLIVIGAILKYATSFSMSGVDRQNIGTICMVAGIIWLLLEVFLASRGTRHETTVDATTHGTSVAGTPATGQPVAGEGHTTVTREDSIG